MEYPGTGSFVYLFGSRARGPRVLPFELLQQPAAIDNLFDQVQRQVEVLTRRFEPDARIIPREVKELASQKNLGLEPAFDFSPPTGALFGGQRAGLVGQGLTRDHEIGLIGNRLENDGRGPSEAKIRLNFAAPRRRRLFHSQLQLGYA